jgi:hypothetical protein
MFEKLTELSQLALKVDNKINGTKAGHNSPAAASNHNTMDILAVNTCLSEAKKVRMMRQGLCFRCEEHGHLSRDFLTKGMPQNQDGKTKGQGRGEREG